MPHICRAMVKTALIWLLTGYTIGGLLLANKALSFFAPIWSLRSSHIYGLLFGWLAQLSMGVMIWVMPRLVTTGDRGDLRPVWVCYATLNAGTVLAALYAPLRLIAADAILNWMMPCAGVLLLVSVVVFLAHIWRRVRPVVVGYASLS
jgi:Na+/phosphate symporter